MLHHLGNNDKINSFLVFSTSAIFSRIFEYFKYLQSFESKDADRKIQKAGCALLVAG